MGLFDFLKKKTTSKPKEDLQTLYFKKGQMYKVEGKDENRWYDADILISDGVKYDLRSVKSIASIKVPDFDNDDVFTGYGVTGSLDYVLRMKAGNLFNRKEKELCSACLWKSAEMMVAHKFWWKKSDYDRLVDWHLDMDMFGEAERAKYWLNKQEVYTSNPFDSAAKSILESTLSACSRFNYDLVVFNDYGHGCCEECAKQTGRVYSISGKNKKFPVLPTYVRVHGNFHPGCRCSMSTYFGDEDDGIFHHGKRVDAVAASKRPYVDDRTDREKKAYQEYVDKIAIDAAEQEAKQIARGEYRKILAYLPESAPKSFSAYRRMKNAKSANFMKLVELAKEKGIEIDLH